MKTEYHTEFNVHLQTECSHPYHQMSHGLQLIRCAHLGAYFIDEYGGAGYYVQQLHRDWPDGNQRWLILRSTIIGQCSCGNRWCDHNLLGKHGMIPLAGREEMWECLNWLLREKQDGD